MKEEKEQPQQQQKQQTNDNQSTTTIRNQLQPRKHNSQTKQNTKIWQNNPKQEQQANKKK